MRAALLLLLLIAAPAQAETVLSLVRTGQWEAADALAAQSPDPLQRKLVLFYRLQTEGAARAAEIAAFLAENPEWPGGPLLTRRLQEALAIEKDDRTVLQICRQLPPQAVPSLLRCADAASTAGLPEAENPARRAWTTGITDPAAEAAFLRRWAGLITPDDQWRRFDRLAWTDTPAPGGAAARQAQRLPAADRQAAEARLALRRDHPTAAALALALPDASRAADPALVLELARWYRRAGQDRDAARVWARWGPAAEAAAAPDRRSAFWDERNILVRRLLRVDDAALAYAVASPPAASPDSALDQAFLSGWIALRRLDRPTDAIEAFTRLAAQSRAAISQARAHYWLGRARDKLDPAAARAEYTLAAGWPTTFYGQLAAMALGEDPTALAARVAAAPDPPWDLARAASFLSRDAARAAVLLAAWGEPRRARPFLSRLDALATEPVERNLAATLALGLGLADEAVAIARRAGRDGIMLPRAGWPVAVEPAAGGGVEPAVVLGVVRQESSFDPGATSPAGARGLMQLMPATAAAVARKLGLSPDIPALTADPGYNMRLGTAYLRELLGRFGQALPLAIAAYNAGPRRVADWQGAPDVPLADMIDWIEMIPFNETRNYVQRVVENVVVYRAKVGMILPHPLQSARGSTQAATTEAAWTTPR